MKSLKQLKGGTLQWGRDRMIAEMEMHRQHAQSVLMLQWGRDRMIAEMGGAETTSSVTLCFNGAAIG